MADHICKFIYDSIPNLFKCDCGNFIMGNINEPKQHSFMIDFHSDKPIGEILELRLLELIKNSIMKEFKLNVNRIELKRNCLIVSFKA
jgi:hypothetical protein